MRLQVKLYGSFALMSGQRQFTLTAEGAQIRVADFLVLLGQRLVKFEALTAGRDPEQVLRQHLLLIVDGKPCRDRAAIIRDGAQIQLLTPVTGG